MSTLSKITLQQAEELKQKLSQKYELIFENETNSISIFKAYKNFGLDKKFYVYLKLPIIIEVNKLKKLAVVKVYPKMKKVTVLSFLCLVVPIIISIFLKALPTGLFVGIFLALEIYITTYYFVYKEIKQIRNTILNSN